LNSIQLVFIKVGWLRSAYFFYGKELILRLKTYIIMPLTIWLLPAFLVAIPLYALLAVYAERKISAFIQDRLGPMEVGYKGLLQTAADILKLLQKEIIIPRSADRILFLGAPVIIFSFVFAGFAVMPLAPGLVGASLSVGILYLVAIVSVDVIGLLMTGWGSNNKYSLLGAIRAVAQIVSYEVPAGLALLAGVMMYGTLQMDQMAFQQGIHDPQAHYFWGIWAVQNVGGVASWGIFRYPHLMGVFVIYFIASLAEANRAPFDMPEAESELVGGFHTEYSGFGFAVLFLAEYAAMLLLAMVASVVFLGGWNTPFPNLIPLANGAQLSLSEQFTNLQFAHLTSGTIGTWSGYAWGMLWMVLKSLTLVAVMMWIRWTYPRLRSDQLLRLCWKYLTPLAFIGVLISAIWKLAEVYGHL